MKYDFIRRRRGEDEKQKRKSLPSSLRYLATEILFKGYCIIFLMRFSSFPLLLASTILPLFFFLLSTVFKRRLAKLCKVITSPWLPLHGAHSTFRLHWKRSFAEEDAAYNKPELA